MSCESAGVRLTRLACAHPLSLHTRTCTHTQTKQPMSVVVGKRVGPDSQHDEEEPASQARRLVKEVVKEAFMNSETSLRHLFYLEYKKNFVDGSANPIVYSRFGKQSYDSMEAFDNNNFT